LSTLPLFGDPAPEKTVLARRLAQYAEHGIYIGTSSWKYEGWLGKVYTPERYFTRGRFSPRKFQAECIKEYAETFPVVCGDFSFYQFPSEAYWRGLFGDTPTGLRFAFKAPEQITSKVFPSHARYGASAGQANQSFLDAALFAEAFARPLSPYRERVAAVIFEFGTFSKKAYAGEGAFLDDLDGFLRRLPEGFRYGVELRNAEFLTPEYFGVLRERRVAHVFNAWTRMPELPVQASLARAWTADFSIVRALLRQGRPYDEAVKKFSPYATVQEVNPGARQGIRMVVNKAREKKQPAFIFVNNRLEGNAPMTIEAILEE
jgi:uncharacterized protein YecE (DUF72 family)